MSSIDALQKAIYSNIDSLREIYRRTEGLYGAIEKVQAEDDVKSQLVDGYNDVIKTLDNHVESTDVLIQALKEALKE